MSSLAESPIPDAVRAVLALFEGPLADVRFPQVDRDSLAEQVAAVELHRAELQQALEAVQHARAALEREQHLLLDQARRAHAYASVFAAGDAALTERLVEITFDGRPLAAAPAKKRGRKPKQGQAQTSLSERRAELSERGAAKPVDLAVSEDAA
jgi:hypothetical protein